MSKELERELSDALKRVPLFAAVSRRQRKTLAQLGHVINWPTGKEGVKQGSSAASFYLILDGAVDVKRDDEPVARLTGGDFFGEIGLLTGRARNASVTTTEPTRLFALGRPAFAGMIRQFPDVSLKLMEAMATREMFLSFGPEAQF